MGVVSPVSLLSTSKQLMDLSGPWKQKPDDPVWMLQALNQNAYFKSQLAEFLRCDVGVCSEQAKVQEALECWGSESAPFKDIEATLRLIPGWCETLRSASVKKVVQTATLALERLVGSHKDILAEDFAKQPEDERVKFIKELQQSSEAITVLAKNLHGKQASLVSLSHQARKLFTSASTAHQQHMHTEAIKFLMDYSDWHGYADADALAVENSFITVVSAEATCPLTHELTELCQNGVLVVAEKVLHSTQARLSLDNLEHSRRLLTAGQKLHRRLGTAKEAELRQACLEVASVHLQLKEFLLQAGKPDAFMAKHGDKVLPESIHLNSMMQRCSDACASSSKAPKAAKGKEAVEKLCAMSAEVIADATTFCQDLANAVHDHTMKQAQVNLNASKTLIGDRANSNAQPLWSLKLTRESSWAEVQKESTKTLQREGYGEKVKALQSKLVADRLD